VKPLPELFRRIRGLKLGHFVIHLGFRNRNAGMGGVVDQDLVVDQFIQDVQLEAHGFFGAVGVRRSALAASVYPLHLVAVDGLAIDARHYLAVRRAFPLAGGERCQARKQREEQRDSKAAMKEWFSHAGIVTRHTDNWGPNIRRSGAIAHARRLSETRKP